MDVSKELTVYVGPKDKDRLEKKMRRINELSTELAQLVSSIPQEFSAQYNNSHTKNS